MDFELVASGGNDCAGSGTSQAIEPRHQSGVVLRLALKHVHVLGKPGGVSVTNLLLGNGRRCSPTAGTPKAIQRLGATTWASTDERPHD